MSTIKLHRLSESTLILHILIILGSFHESSWFVNYSMFFVASDCVEMTLALHSCQHLLHVSVKLNWHFKNVMLWYFEICLL